MTDVAHGQGPRTLRWRLGLVCIVVAAATASIGLGNEGYVSTHGDMPRYLMNGVFLFDALRDRPFDSLDTVVEYARLYYARYPALSIGHHPVLVSLADVPAFALFGVSVFAARLPVIASFVLATLYLYRLVAEWHDEWAGAAAALVFATSPLLVELSQSVMSEPPAVALLVIAAYYLHRFCEAGTRGALAAFVICAGASVWAKQLAVVAFPGFFCYAVARLGWRRLLARDSLIAAAALAGIVLLMVPFTLAMSPTNVRAASDSVGGLTDAGQTWRLLREMARALATHVSALLAVMAAGGLALAVFRRRDEAWLLVPWIAGNFLLVFAATRFMEVARYTVYWVPAWAAAAGVTCGRGRWPRPAVAVVAVLLVVQATRVSGQRLQGAGGYEQAAQYVLAHPHGATVLFSGDVDTGYFVFFVRKHDPERRAIVLRSDKVLTTSFMGRVEVEVRINQPEDIRRRLADLGVGYVVVEDRPSQSPVLEWLRTEVTSDAYAERLRVPIASSDRRLVGTDLVVYEIKGPRALAPNVRLDMRLPLVSREVDVLVSDLVQRKYLR
jgi:hypothetical protein